MPLAREVLPDHTGGSRFRGSGFGVRGSGFAVRGSRFGGRGSGFAVRGSRFAVRGSRFAVRGSRFGDGRRLAAGARPGDRTQFYAKVRDVAEMYVESGTDRTGHHRPRGIAGVGVAVWWAAAARASG
ncbi:hypothetical protein F1D05_25790 [Kribbella qitaiheensis]|uniref:Uncharacterized protein n=1 Tax=Kribbella qitaiheensis TaxID=1544730 RepID=A0A7G6X385_9ACTN|nr:hypothetical protein F1D05_25790 [Kribbella qitaiheensis]